MSDTTPAGPPESPEPAAGGDTNAKPSRGPRRAVILSLVGIGAVALIGGGAWAAFSQLSGGGSQPHDVLPADTVAYARIDLDPSASQKIELVRLANRVPDFAKEVGITDEDVDLRKLILEEAAGDCVDYEDDVEPWLGERVGIGAGPDIAETGEDVRIAVQVTDEDAARDGIESLFKCGGGSTDYGLAFTDGYAILTPTQKSADDAVKAAEEESLADTDRFTEDFDALGEEGIVSGWADYEALAESAAGDAGLGDIEAVTDQVSSVAFAVSASSRSLNFDAVASSGDNEFDLPEVRGLGALPEDTLMGVSFAGGGQAVDENWDEIKAALDELAGLGSSFNSPDPYGLDSGLDSEFDSDLESEFNSDISELDIDPGYGPTGSPTDDAIEQLEQQFDLTLPDDLVTFLGDALTLYVGSEGLEDAIAAQDPTGIPAGLVMEGDVDKASDLADHLVSIFSQQAGLQLATTAGDEAVSIATNDDVAEALVEDGGLADTEAYKSVIDGDAQIGGVFVNIEALLAALEDTDPSLTDSEEFEIAKNFEAIGAAGWVDGDHLKFTLGVSFTEQK